MAPIAGPSIPLQTPTPSKTRLARRIWPYELLPAAWAFACLALTFLGGAASAQVADAVLGGQVVSAEGQGVAAARVFARGDGARDGLELRRSTVADADGFYVFPPLPPGEWDVEASAEGFTVAVIGDVRLAVAQSRRLDLELEASDAQEMVSFVDYEPLVRTGPAVGESLDWWELRDLPLRERSVSELWSLTTENVAAPSPPPDLRLDGGLVTPRFGPPLSSLREAELKAAGYGPEFSGATGVISLVTRTGGTTAKGSAFAFQREDVDAGAFAQLPETQFGATFGGPLGRQSSKRGSHFLASAEARSGAATPGTTHGHALPVDPGDRRDFLLRGSRHDRSNSLRLRYLRSDPEALGHNDSLLFGWQTRVTPSVYHHALAQVESLDLPGLESDLRFEHRFQLRSDLYVSSSRGSGLHDLALGVESVQENSIRRTTDTTSTAGDAETWSLYARDRWQVNDRLQLSGGLRSEFFDDAGGSTDRVAPRVGLVWRLSESGSHLLRGGMGRFHEPAAGLESDQLNLGWSWQMGPVVGVTVDAVSSDSDHVILDYDALSLTVRSRFGGVFQVRASFSWAEPSVDPSGETVDRAVVTGLYRAPADVLVAAVYRSRSAPAQHPEPMHEGFDLRVAKGVSVGGDVTLELLAEVFDVFEEQSSEDGSRETGRVGQLGLRLSF